MSNVCKLCEKNSSGNKVSWWVYYAHAKKICSSKKNWKPTTNFLCKIIVKLFSLEIVLLCMYIYKHPKSLTKDWWCVLCVKRCPHLSRGLNGCCSYNGALKESCKGTTAHVTRPCSMIPPKSLPVICSSLSGNLGKNWYSSNMFFNIHTNRSWDRQDKEREKERPTSTN